MNKFEYLRNKANKKIGVLIAVVIGNDVQFGWSKCNKCDEFSRSLGTRIATDRARSKKNAIEMHKLPHSMRHEMAAFVLRSTKYYKDKNI